MSRRIYLGGPDVFLPDSISLFDAKMKLCAAAGFEGVPPGAGQDTSSPPGTPPPDQSRRIFRADVTTIDSCDLGIFHLTPFRGASADAGSCVEIGIMYQQGKPIFGYTNVAGDYLERIVPRQKAQTTFGPGLADVDGCAIEDFGNADNLMIDSAIALAGALIVRTDVPLPARFTDLSGFEACLALAARHFEESPVSRGAAGNPTVAA